MELKERIEKLKYIALEMKNGNYTILGDNISNGTVFKIHFRGNLGKDFFEKGFLFIPEGSGIKEHTHTNDIELYRLIDGSLSVGGEFMDSNMCFIGESHNIDTAIQDTFIETFKVSKKYLDLLGDDYTLDKVKTLVRTYIRTEYEIGL